jgi:hypothetical protein
MHEWVQDFGHKKKSVLHRLTKESVREHKNVLRQGETGVSQALVNPLGLPTLEDVKLKHPPRGVRSSVVGKHEGKSVYFSPDMYGKGGDVSPVPSGVGSPSSYASPYSPPSADSEVSSSQDLQRYAWTPGLSREGEGSVPASTEDFYTAARSNSLPPVTLLPDTPQSTGDFCSATPDPRRSVTEGYAVSPQWGPSREAQDFYGSPGPISPQFKSPLPGSPQQPGDQASRNPFPQQPKPPSQPQSRGMNFYTQSPQQSPQSPYNFQYTPTPQISPGAALFYASPPPQHFVSQPGKDGQGDPLAELTANLRKL